jgi:transcriptional regulator of acetoin/glycerol metabolism
VGIAADQQRRGAVLLTWRQYRLVSGRQYLLALLDDCSWNITAAARRAGCNRTSFYQMLITHDIDVGRARENSRRPAELCA